MLELRVSRPIETRGRHRCGSVDEIDDTSRGGGRGAQVVKLSAQIGCGLNLNRGVRCGLAGDREAVTVSANGRDRNKRSENVDCASHTESTMDSAEIGERSCLTERVAVYGGGTRRRSARAVDVGG